MSTVVNGEPHQQLLTTFLGKMIDLYSVLCYHFSDAMAEVDRVAEDEGLKQSLRRYAIESGAITERVYHKEMEAPIEDIGASKRRKVRTVDFCDTLTLVPQ